MKLASHEPRRVGGISSTGNLYSTCCRARCVLTVIMGVALATIPPVFCFAEPATRDSTPGNRFRIELKDYQYYNAMNGPFIQIADREWVYVFGQFDVKRNIHRALMVRIEAEAEPLAEQQRDPESHPRDHFLHP